jgi:hypothetical protein
LASVSPPPLEKMLVHSCLAVVNSVICQYSQPKTYRAMRTGVAAHVLNNAQHLQAHSCAKVELFSHIIQRNFLTVVVRVRLATCHQSEDHLRRSHQYTRYRGHIFQQLDHCNVLIGGAWRGVNHKVIQLAPMHIV